MSINIPRLQKIREQIVEGIYLSDAIACIVIGLIILRILFFNIDIIFKIIIAILYIVLCFFILKANLLERVINNFDWLFTSKVYHLTDGQMNYLLPYDVQSAGAINDIGLLYKRPTVLQGGAIAAAIEVKIHEFFDLLTYEEQERRMSVYSKIIHSLKVPYRDSISRVPINSAPILAKYDKSIQDTNNIYMKNYLFEQKEFLKKYVVDNDVSTLKAVLVLEVRAKYSSFFQRLKQRLKGQEEQYFVDNDEREEELLMELSVLSDMLENLGFDYKLYNESELISLLQEEWVSTELASREHTFKDDITFHKPTLDQIELDIDAETMAKNTKKESDDSVET